ncbi:Membrane magnesium transporter 1-B-like [Homarus americanus]|uniref:Membrane magnesium transporter 1-B-like n=1 Tax=Homarus americanus TaxID=6706 RepID=A0A8J5JU23_HOMAM|nr:Membrane magnesium transporter 1-B-like [Homarus americanus]
MAYVIVRGTLGHASVEVEGLDSALHKREDIYSNILEALGFTIGEGGVVLKKPGSYGVCDTLRCGKRVLVLQPYMFPTDVLNKLREASFKVVTSAALASGAIIGVQGLLSLLLAMYGILHIAGDFKEIRANVQLQNKSWETVGNRPTFYTFAHRGRALSPNYTPPKSKSLLDNVENITT